MINACIYDNFGELKGCITPSVIEQFQLQFDNLQDIDYELHDILEKLLDISKEKTSAQFLNGLKLVVRKHTYDLPMQIMQKISRAYHNLVRYCCSQSVYNEVFDETISLLREKGLQYKGKDIQGVNDDECAFEYDGITVGIKIRNESDLYNIYNDSENEMKAVVYLKDKKYIITEKYNFQNFINAIIACIEDCKCDEEDNDHHSLEDVAEQILQVAQMLINAVK